MIRKSSDVLLRCSPLEVVNKRKIECNREKSPASMKRHKRSEIAGPFSVQSVFSTKAVTALMNEKKTIK